VLNHLSVTVRSSSVYFFFDDESVKKHFTSRVFSPRGRGTSLMATLTPVRPLFRVHAEITPSGEGAG
jgi:hypothetical protein